MRAGLAIAGARVVVTGATGGIGRAIAAALQRSGASVTISGRDGVRLEALRRELSVASAIVADLVDASSPAELAARAGEIDILVANAALPASGLLDSFTPAQIDRAVDVNLRAPIQLVRAVLPGMLERRRGHIVLLSSVSGKAASPRTLLYAATKFGLRGFGLGLRQDLRGSGVGVTTVFPGFIRDAGMFAETGIRLPVGVGSRRADQVAAAVIRGIERDRAEVDVMPLAMRLGVALAGMAPVLSAATQRWWGGEELAARISGALASKR